MNEQDDTHIVAASGCKNGQQSVGGRQERPHADGPVVSIRSQHGSDMADLAQPASRQSEGKSSQDMGCGRSSGKAMPRQKRSMVADAPLAKLGQFSGGDAEAVRPQERQNAVGARVTINAVMAMLERQEYRCALTGRLLEPETAALDHIIPLRCGGQHVLKNTQVLHKDVNRAKGSMTTEEFLDLCREVVRFSTCSAIEKDEQKRAG